MTSSLLLFFSGLALGAVYARLLPVLRRPRKAADLITDGFGNFWRRRCWCGGEHEIVRPGFVQCSREEKHAGYYDRMEGDYHSQGHNYHSQEQDKQELSGELQQWQELASRTLEFDPEEIEADISQAFLEYRDSASGPGNDYHPEGHNGNGMPGWY